MTKQLIFLHFFGIIRLEKKTKNKKTKKRRKNHA